MAGNVWEWCHDSYDENYHASSPKANPQGSTSSKTKVLRGSSWALTPRYTRVSYRSKYNASYHDEFKGFRCVRSPS